MNTSPENNYPPHQLSNPSHLRTVPQPFTRKKFTFAVITILYFQLFIYELKF